MGIGTFLWIPDDAKGLLRLISQGRCKRHYQNTAEVANARITIATSLTALVSIRRLQVRKNKKSDKTECTFTRNTIPAIPVPSLLQKPPAE